MSIPEFNNLGYLPPGVYETSWQEFMERFAIDPHRQRLGTCILIKYQQNGLCLRQAIANDSAQPSEVERSRHRSLELIGTLFFS